MSIIVKLKLFVPIFFYALLAVSCTIKIELEDELKESFIPSDTVLLKANLRILDIGNSYTDDATSLLPFIVDKLGVDISDMCLYKATLGGASFKDWYDVYHNNGATYKVLKVLGGLKANIIEGEANSKDGNLFNKLLKDESWDVIIIHPKGRYSTFYDDWWGHSDSGYLKELLEIIRMNQPQCLIGFLLVHSPSDDYPTNIEKSSYERWSNIAQAASRFVQEQRINILIPYGTAVENLRSTSFNNEFDLTRDGYHLGFGLTRYSAACCYYESLLSHRTGVSILGKDIMYLIEDKPDVSQYSVTDDNMHIAQKAAVLAYLYPYDNINPETVNENAIYSH